MIMQPASDIKTSCPCDRITLWVSGHQSIARLIITTIGLIVVLLVMPSYLRNIFWDGIQNHKILTSLLLIFGILAVSLVWSAGQIIDTWVFSYFNVYGTAPFGWIGSCLLLRNLAVEFPHWCLPWFFFLQIIAALHMSM